MGELIKFPTNEDPFVTPLETPSDHVCQVCGGSGYILVDGNRVVDCEDCNG